MPEIEFISDEPAEVVDAEPRRPQPRWLILLAVGGLVLVAVVFVLHNKDGASRPAAQPSVTASASIAPSPSGGQSSPLSEPGPLPAIDVVVSDSQWSLRPLQIDQTTLNGRRSHAAIPAPALIDEMGNSTARLVIDQRADRLWVAVAAQFGRPFGRVLEYEASSLRLLHDVRSTPSFTAAAAYDGELYLTGEHDLVAVRSDGSLHTIFRTTQQLGAIVADPTRGRLIVADVGGPTQLWAVTPAGALRQLAPQHVTTPVSVAVAGGKATLAVAGEDIWLAGYGDGRAVLARLDPTTLLPVVHSPSEVAFAPGAIAESGGSAVIWVRDGNYDTLRCIDASTGRQLQTWNIAGAVSSTFASGAVVATDGGLVNLKLGACPG